MGVNQKDYLAKLQKAQALRHNVDQAGKTVLRKVTGEALGLHFCLFRISIFLRLLLFCLCFLLIIRKNIHVLAGIKALLMSHHIKKKGLKTGFLCLVSTHLLLFSCTLHRLCISLLSRGLLLCSSCTAKCVIFRKSIPTTQKESIYKYV